MLFLYLGITSMIRNLYNPFADPVMGLFAITMVVFTIPIKYLLAFVSKSCKLWEVKGDDRAYIDIGSVNRLDHASSTKKMIRNMQTHPFRHKFIMRNREWIVDNIAIILGGKNYESQAGPELNYLKQIYQSAVNTEALANKLEGDQARMERDLALMPYN